MCTFLGTAGKINENDVDVNAVKNSEMIFLEGYLWDEGNPKKAFDKAIQNSNKVAMSLSDQFCVERHKTHFLELVKNKRIIKRYSQKHIFVAPEFFKIFIIYPPRPLSERQTVNSIENFTSIAILRKK